MKSRNFFITDENSSDALEEITQKINAKYQKAVELSNVKQDSLNVHSVLDQSREE